MGQRQKTPLTHLLIISCPECAQQGGATLVDLGLGLAEVARVPRIGDLMRMIRVVQQQMTLFSGSPPKMRSISRRLRASMPMK